MQLARLYIEYRLKKIVTGAWANQSTNCWTLAGCDAARGGALSADEGAGADANKQRQEAEWILDDYKRSGTDKSTPQWGYYLYLCTLQEREPSLCGSYGGRDESFYSKKIRRAPCCFGSFCF